MNLDQLIIMRAIDSPGRLLRRFLALCGIYFLFSFCGALIVLLGKAFFFSAGPFSLWLILSIVIVLWVKALLAEPSSVLEKKTYNLVVTLAPFTLLVVVGALLAINAPHVRDLFDQVFLFISAKLIFSVGVLFSALYVLIRRPQDAKAREWVYVVLGLLLGYWLR